MKKGHQHSPLVALFKIRGMDQRASNCGIFPDGSRKMVGGAGTSPSMLPKAPEFHFMRKRGQEKCGEPQGFAATWERQLAAGAGEGNRTLVFSLGS